MWGFCAFKGSNSACAAARKPALLALSVSIAACGVWVTPLDRAECARQVGLDICIEALRRHFFDCRPAAYRCRIVEQNIDFAGILLQQGRNGRSVGGVDRNGGHVDAVAPESFDLLLRSLGVPDARTKSKRRRSVGTTRRNLDGSADQTERLARALADSGESSTTEGWEPDASLSLLGAERTLVNVRTWPQADIAGWARVCLRRGVLLVGFWPAIVEKRPSRWLSSLTSTRLMGHSVPQPGGQKRTFDMNDHKQASLPYLCLSVGGQHFIRECDVRRHISPSGYLRLHLVNGKDTQRPMTIHADNALPNDRLCSSRRREKG